MSTVPSQHHGLHLFDLPVEVLDEIFKLAYPREKEDWDCKQIHWGYLGRPSRRVGNLFCSIPRQHKIDGLLVSKSFFESAARAWVRNQKPIDMKLLRMTFGMGETGGILARHAKVIRGNAHQMGSYVCKALPAVKTAILVIREIDLKPKGRRDPASNDLTHDDLSSLRVCANIRRMTGLSGLQLVLDKDSILRVKGGSGGRERKQQRRKQLQANVEMFQAFLKPFVTVPKGTQCFEPPEDHEIPHDPNELVGFVMRNRESVAAWIEDAKETKKFAAWLQDPEAVKKAYQSYTKETPPTQDE